jgi:hypothetical protein
LVRLSEKNSIAGFIQGSSAIAEGPFLFSHMLIDDSEEADARYAILPN